MADLRIESEPGDAGLDAARLTRIDTYLQRAVDDGVIPGWQFVLTRHGDVAHTSVGGLRDRDQGLPVEGDTLFRIYSMTKPVARWRR